MDPSTKRTVKDYVAILASAATIIMSGMALVSIAGYFRMIGSINESMAGVGGFSDSITQMMIGYWCCLVESFLFVGVGVCSVIYIQRYLRDQPPKVAVGYVANFGALVMSGTLLGGLIVASNVYSSSVMYVPVYVSASAGLLGFYVALIAIAFSLQVASTVLMYKWEDPAACKVINIMQTTPGAIMLEQSALNTKREAPPILNANPTAPTPTAGRNVGVDNQNAAAAAAPQQATAVPMQTYDTSMQQPVTTMPQQGYDATAQQTAAAQQPGFNAPTTTFAQPGLEPTMDPYAQSGVYIQPDNGFNQFQNGQPQ